MGKLMRFSWSWGYPNSWMVYNGRSYLKWMIWGYSLLGNRYMYIIYTYTHVENASFDDPTGTSKLEGCAIFHHL